MEIKRTEEELGKEFTNELNEILLIRAERKKIYGDSFLQETPEALLSIIDGKRRRFDTLFKIGNKDEKITFKIIDEVRDIVNYYLFLLCVLDKMKKEKHL